MKAESLYYPLTSCLELPRKRPIIVFREKLAAFYKALNFAPDLFYHLGADIRVVSVFFKKCALYAFKQLFRRQYAFFGVFPRIEHGDHVIRKIVHRMDGAGVHIENYIISV